MRHQLTRDGCKNYNSQSARRVGGRGLHFGKEGPETQFRRMMGPRVVGCTVRVPRWAIR